MIEVASHPADLRNWNPRESLYYLEVFGETQPLVDVNYAEVQPAGEAPRESWGLHSLRGWSNATSQQVPPGGP